MKKISLKSLKSEELLSREELKQIVGGETGSTQTNCGIKIDGEWRRLNVSTEEGAAKAQEYVANGWATNWCCDSCNW